MSKMFDLTVGAFIQPITHADIKTVESNIDGDPAKDWMIVTSPYILFEGVILGYAMEKSGLHEGWMVVPGYPFLNADKLWEWRLRRKL